MKKKRTCFAVLFIALIVIGVIIYCFICVDEYKKPYYLPIIEPELDEVSFDEIQLAPFPQKMVLYLKPAENADDPPILIKGGEDTEYYKSISECSFTTIDEETALKIIENVSQDNFNLYFSIIPSDDEEVDKFMMPELFVGTEQNGKKYLVAVYICINREDFIKNNNYESVFYEAAIKKPYSEKKYVVYEVNGELIPMSKGFPDTVEIIPREIHFYQKSAYLYEKHRWLYKLLGYDKFSKLGALKLKWLDEIEAERGH
ncbi:MAG: hypothetical protein IJK23_04470 [Clostridia bacterium]|nr:hypothetical protein [Clostridia bacterium]